MPEQRRDPSLVFRRPRHHRHQLAALGRDARARDRCLDIAPAASRNYYAAVGQILDDLEVQAKKGGSYNKSSVWHDNFAKKIDAIFKELTENLVPNGRMVPAGIVAVNRAQERGYSFVYVV